MEDILSLERFFFDDGDHQPETREAYDMILEIGEVLLRYSGDRPRGMLSLVPVDTIMRNKERILSLPEDAPFRERVRRGYLNGYEGFTFIHTFVSEGLSSDLTRGFRSLERAMGFVYEGDSRALDFYSRLSCRIAGRVENIHSPGRWDYVLTYERKL